jgi:hypothetical protein
LEDVSALKQEQKELEEKMNNQDSNKEKEMKILQDKIKKTNAFLEKNSKSSQEFKRVKKTQIVFKINF